MNIIKNLLPKTYADEIEASLCSEKFPWHYNSTTYNKHDVDLGFVFNEETEDTGQFTHSILSRKNQHKSEYFGLIFPILVLLEKETDKEFTSRLVRIKCNLITREANYNENFHNPAHVDVAGLDTAESLVYYVNDSDGDTFMFNEYINPSNKKQKITLKDRVSPEKGKMILFNSTKLHASSPPRINKSRIVINFVFET